VTGWSANTAYRGGRDRSNLASFAFPISIIVCEQVLDITMAQVEPKAEQTLRVDVVMNRYEIDPIGPG
jgi:hypothetical protein